MIQIDPYLVFAIPVILGIYAVILILIYTDKQD